MGVTDLAWERGVCVGGGGLLLCSHVSCTACGAGSAWSADCAVGGCLQAAGLSPYNTRVFKGADGSLEVRIASAATGPFEGLTAETTFEGVCAMDCAHAVCICTV